MSPVVSASISCACNDTRLWGGRIVGFDASRALLAAACHTIAGCETVALIAADAHALPCPDETFDAVRIDRSLQHIEAPAAVIAEMRRITRPGGVVAASEPDWSSFSLGFEGEDPAVAAITAEWAAGFRNPRIGSELADLFATCGLAACVRHTQAITVRDWAAADRVFDIVENVRRCVAKGLIDAPPAERLLATLIEHADRGDFAARLHIHTLIGRKTPIPS